MDDTRPDSRALRPSQVSVKTVAVITFTVLGIAGVLALIYAAGTAMGLIIASLVVAVALHHAVDFLTRHRWKRGWAIATVLVSTLLVLGLALLLALPPAIHQGTEMVRRSPELYERARNSELYQRIDARVPIDRYLQEAKAQAVAQPGRVVDPALKVVRGLLGALGAFLAVFGTAAMLMIFGGRVVKRALVEAVQDRRRRYERVLSNMYRSIGGYIGGLSMLAASEGVATAIFLAVIGVPFFLPLGLLAGFGAFIPLVGAMIAGTLVTIVAFITGGVAKGIAAIVFFLLLQQVENHILAPLVYRKTVDINPAINVVALLVMTELFGILGAVLCVPAVACLQIIVRELFVYRREQLQVAPDEPVSDPPEGAETLERLNAPH